MIWNSYGTPKEFGGMSGMQSEVAPVSCGSAARLTRYFSAPGFNVGPGAGPTPLRPAPAKRLAQPNTPEKSGFPSGIRGIPAPVDVDVPVPFTGVVPGIV